MTRKDFVAIAAALRSVRPESAGPSCPVFAKWADTCRAMASYCATTNKNFDRFKFLDACGL